jgi:hypothetical protein
MAEPVEKVPYVNPYQELGDKAHANMVAEQNAYAQQKAREAQTAAYGQAANSRGNWQALVQAMMAKRKKPAMPQALVQQFPELGGGGFGG